MLGAASLGRSVATSLRVARLALDISEAEAAAAYGVTLRTYRRYERGAPQGVFGWLNFAKAYGVSLC